MNSNNSKYLLYIDILGFTEIVKTDYSKIEKLFSTIDNLNAHSDSEFQTLAFSDTILIFNKDSPVTINDHEKIVMFCCEFAQDLTFKCRDLDIQFRAILTYEEFYYQKLNNIEAYFGKALINAYIKEKAIVGTGLYIDKNLLIYNKIFPTVRFDEDLCFVFLLQGIERIYKYGFMKFPIPSHLIDNEYYGYGIKEEIQILKTIKSNIESQSNSKVRSKYLQTYHFYKVRYKAMIDNLEEHEFDFKIISPDADWDKVDPIIN